jgi:hypothetical protein
MMTRSSRQRNLGHGHGSDAWSAELQGCIELLKSKVYQMYLPMVRYRARECILSSFCLMVRVRE